jgi:hypothetical protein
LENGRVMVNVAAAAFKMDPSEVTAGEVKPLQILRDERRRHKKEQDQFR